MKTPNIFKQIISETAFCKTHLTSKVNRNPETGKWPIRCQRGWYLWKTGQIANCRIIIEGDGYTIQ